MSRLQLTETADIERILEWLGDNWLSVVLSGEIIGAVIAVKLGCYKKGICWLLAAMATIWVGAY